MPRSGRLEERAAAEAVNMEAGHALSEDVTGSEHSEPANIESASPLESEAGEKPMFANPMQAEDFSSEVDLLDLDKVESDTESSVKREINDRENLSVSSDLLQIEETKAENRETKCCRIPIAKIA